MSKSLFILSLSLVLLYHAVPVLADGYDDCIAACNPIVAPCVEQVRLTAGNIQEEEDGIAACNKSKADCIQACKDSETTTSAPPPPQEKKPEAQPPVDFNGDIKTYDGSGLKTYEFK